MVTSWHRWGGELVDDDDDDNEKVSSNAERTAFILHGFLDPTATWMIRELFIGAAVVVDIVCTAIASSTITADRRQTLG